MTTPSTVSTKRQMSDFFTREYHIRYNEVDFRGMLRPVSILDYLQDAASGHSQGSGISVRDLRQRNMTWVVSRYHIQFLSYPTFGDSLFVRTWRSRLDGHFALREFEVSDASDRPVALATSSWAIISLGTKRPVKIDTVISNLPTTEQRALPDEFAPLPRLDHVGMEECYRVQMSDLDLNHHVNNTVYLKWALETVPTDILQHFAPSDVEICYRAEAVYGDAVVVRSTKPDTMNPHLLLHQLINQRNGRELTRLRSTWRQID